MTEEQNPPTTKAGIFLFLGKRKKQRRASHIPTAPATAVRLVQNLNRKGASSTTVQTPPSGSFFDWKRLPRSPFRMMGDTLEPMKIGISLPEAAGMVAAPDTVAPVSCPKSPQHKLTLSS